MSNAKDYAQEIEQIQNLLDGGEVTQALNATKQILAQEPNNPNLQFCCSGIFIDCGSVLKDIQLVEAGITLIEDLLKGNANQPSLYRGILHYNLSNGYAEIGALKRDSNSKDGELEAFQKQKQILQKVLLEKENLPDELLSRAMSNYANLLDHLGRTVEAVDRYYDCLEIAPEHATAMGNCGSALQRLLNISPAYNDKILYEAWQLMKKANQHKDNLIRLSGRHMISHYKDSLKNFENYIESVIPGGCIGLEKRISEFEKAHEWQPSSTLDKLKKDRLLLTVNPQPSNCPSEYKDNIFLERIISATDESGQKLFQALGHTFNHMKEDFATARYLYYQSQSQEPSLLEVSTITSYVDTLDYADFGLRSGFLKSSLRLAADLLDKCAGFLNLYLDLQHPEDKVILNNVWYKNRQYKKGLLSSNQYLAALHDLNKDLYLGEYPASFRNLRNEATHKRLVLSWYGSLDKSDSSYSLKSFQTNVRFLLRMAKAAIIYVAGVVMIEEQERELEYQKLGGENLIAPGLPFRIGSGLSDEVDTQT